jgi:hypothetical protein
MQINQTIEQQANREPFTVVIEAKNCNLPTFESLIIQAVDATFSALGNKNQIYRLLETKYSLSRIALAYDTEAFEAALKDMFGEASGLIEISLIRNLHNRAPKFQFHLDKNQELTLNNYLHRLKYYLA